MGRTASLTLWTLVLLAARPGLALAQTCVDAPINLIVQAETRGAVPELFDGMIGSGDIDDASPTSNRLEVPVVPGATGRVTVYAAFVSQLGAIEEGGVSGWSLVCVVHGDLQLITATTAGTAADDEANGGFFSSGFNSTQPFHAEIDGDPVITSGVLLSLDNSRMLPARGTASVLAIHLEAPAPQPEDDGVAFVGGIDWRGGEGYIPVFNFADALTERHLFCRLQDVEIAFVADPNSRPFQRGDANADGRMDIADVVFALSALFREGELPTCEDAADTDDSGVFEIADPIFGLEYLFRAGPVPGAPFGGCGEDPTDDLLRCVPPSTCL